MNSLNTPNPRTQGIIWFVIGLLLAVLLVAAQTWASLEGAFYGFQPMPGEIFDGLVCPPLMTAHETVQIQVRVSNPTEKTIEPILRLDVSTRGLPETREVQLKIEPGASGQFEQAITAENIDLKYFVFAKAYRYPAYSLPNAEATCGIFVVNLPWLTGRQVFYLWLAASLILMPLGLWRWSASLEPKGGGRLINAAKALAALTLGGLLASLQGAWFLGLLFLALILLAAIAMLRFAAVK